MIELESNKKSGNPPISTLTPPFSGLSPLSSKKFQTPQVTQFLEGPLIRGRGVPTMYGHVNLAENIHKILGYVLVTCCLNIQICYIYITLYSTNNLLAHLYL